MDSMSLFNIKEIKTWITEPLYKDDSDTVISKVTFVKEDGKTFNITCFTKGTVKDLKITHSKEKYYGE